MMKHVGFMVLFAVLVSCGGKDRSATTTNEAPETTSPTAADTQAESASTPAVEDVVAAPGGQPTTYEKCVAEAAEAQRTRLRKAGIEFTEENGALRAEATDQSQGALLAEEAERSFRNRQFCQKLQPENCWNKPNHFLCEGLLEDWTF